MSASPAIETDRQCRAAADYVPLTDVTITEAFPPAAQRDTVTTVTETVNSMRHSHGPESGCYRSDNPAIETLVPEKNSTKLRSVLHAVALLPGLRHKDETSRTDVKKCSMDFASNEHCVFQAAASGRLTDMETLLLSDPELVNVTDPRGRTVVHVAAANNRSSIVNLLRHLGANINAQDNDGNTPLHLAVENEAMKSIDILILSGADTGVLNQAKMAAIHLATQLNKVAVLQRLVSYRLRIDIMQPGEHGRTALHIAAIHDFSDCARILLSELRASLRQACENGFYPMHEAARHAACNTMQVLLEWSESVGCNSVEMMNFYDAEGNVPLHSAVHSGDIKAVELCLRSGAKISTQQHDLSTPVHLASAQGNLNLIRLMFEMQPQEIGGCLTTQDAQKMTSLHCAAMFDHDHVVRYLFSRGAELEVRDCEGRTPLLLAASRGAWRTVHALIEMGAVLTVTDHCNRNILHLIVLNGGRLKDFTKELDKCVRTILDDKDYCGCSALHYASWHGHLQVLKELLDYGANISQKNNRNENPLHVASRYGRYEIVRHLVNSEKGAVILNESDGDGLTPLHIASQNGHNRVVHFLLNRGALLHRDHLGRTPLHLAAISGHADTLKLLLSVHSHLLDQQDKEGNTALHLATMENKPRVINLLLSMNCKLIPNNKQLQPVDYAIYYKNADAALALVTHPKRGDEIMLQRSERTPCVMIGLINGLPHVAEAVMDRCIVRANCKSDSKSFYVHYSFRFLGIPTESLDIYRKLHDNPNWKPEPLSVMNAMVRHGRVELLSHPLCQKFLEFKWRSYGMYFHLADLLLYIFFLGCVTIFSSEVMVNSRSSFSNQTANYRPLEDTAVAHEAIRYQSSMTYICGPSILAYIGISSMREVFHITRQRHRYFGDISNIIAWILYITSAIMIFPITFGDFEPLNYTCAAYATFLCWFNLLIYLQRFDHVGIYVVMFLEILKTLLKVLLVFSILIIAFGLAFYILMSNENQVGFLHVPIAFLRTFSMMLGEIDFLGTFVRPFYSSDNQNSFYLPYTTFSMLCVFMILMPVLLMNLLIGLAVGDIESVRRNAQLKRLAMQVEMHTDLERRLPEFLLNRVDKTELVDYPNDANEKTAWFDYVLNCLVQSPFAEATNNRKKFSRRSKSLRSSLRSSRGHQRLITDSKTYERHFYQEMTNRGSKMCEVLNILENHGHLLRQIAQKVDLQTAVDELDIDSHVTESEDLGIHYQSYRREY